MSFLSKIFIKKTYKDPVCGMGTADTIMYEYNGKQYYFCSEHCKTEFEADPEKYVKDVE